jgi:CxxC-x17-CxxC domain-containing protein
MTFQDKSIQCFDCGSSFTLSTAEQQFSHSIGHNNDPKRCPSCRQVRKVRQAKVGDRNITATYQLQQQQLFHATCSRCGKSTQVPFEPRAGRSVYCRDCYSVIRVGR